MLQEPVQLGKLLLPNHTADKQFSTVRRAQNGQGEHELGTQPLFWELLSKKGTGVNMQT